MSITIRDCSIKAQEHTIIQSLSWEAGEKNWLITGPNGSGKSVLVSALAGFFDIVPNRNGFYSNSAGDSIAIVSFEAAAAIIEEEIRQDNSDFVEGGIDEGRTPRQLLLETLSGTKNNTHMPDSRIEENDAVILCGIVNILDRGLKYLSTGEIRRTLLCRALSAKPRVLILDEPYEGLDVASRQKLQTVLETGLDDTQIMLVMDRPVFVPASITHILELSNRAVSFSGPRTEYARSLVPVPDTEQNRNLEQQITEAHDQSKNTLSINTQNPCDILVEMKSVTVEWSGRKVLDNLSWSLKRGEHWLIRGPNGSGKTTFLELITGDNPQVFRNDVWLFGAKRGTGETIWELKEKMGIVSYRLHTEYRSLGDLPLETVLLSGLHDSIGLYQQCGEEERALAQKWLSLSGFSERSRDLFRDLSYGEQRAILIARAAIKQPQILILDEPCHGLDASHRQRTLLLLEKIAEGGSSTLLHVTHDETETLACERHILELCPEEAPMYKILTR